MSNRKRAKKSHPWKGTDSSSHSSYPSERKCRVHSSMSPNTEKRCRSSDRVILLGILPINTTRRSSCGQGYPIHEQGLLDRDPPCMASHHTVPWPGPPSNAAGKAAPLWLSEVTEGLWTPKFPAPDSQPSITHYCTFLLEDPLPLVVVLCIITVSIRAENRYMSYRIMRVSEE